MAQYARFHIRLKEGRTTISMDNVLSDLLSIHLSGHIDHSASRQWCQKQIDEDPEAFRFAASQRLSGLAALEVAGKKLRDAYWDVQLAHRKDNKLSKRRHAAARPH